LFLDGKAFNPQQVTSGVVTATNVPGATLMPNARGLPGHNLHTWTGGWGTVTYWNAFVAVNEPHGIGRGLPFRIEMSSAQVKPVILIPADCFFARMLMAIRSAVICSTMRAFSSLPPSTGRTPGIFRANSNATVRAGS
jgi:hypothetical protein